MNSYKEMADIALGIALEASEVALSYFRKTALLIEFKEDKTPVTVADKKTEEIIRKQLSSYFPEHGILGEEFGNESLNSDYVWTIDPIDGTKSFIRGIPLFGTLVGLLHHHEPVIGVMVLPGLKEAYVASKGQGAFCNGDRVHVSNTLKLKEAMISVGDVDAFEEIKKRDYLHRMMEEAKVVRGYTDCFGHSLVIRGALDAMIDPVVMPWDIVPIACLVKEAGGEYFTFEGQRVLSRQASSFISCAPGIQNDLL